MVIYLFNCLTYIAKIKYGNFCCLVYLRITYYCKLSDVKNRGSFRKLVFFSVGSFRCLDTFDCIFTMCTNFNTQTSIVHECFCHQFDDFIKIVCDPFPWTASRWQCHLLKSDLSMGNKIHSLNIFLKLELNFYF